MNTHRPLHYSALSLCWTSGSNLNTFYIIIHILLNLVIPHYKLLYAMFNPSTLYYVSYPVFIIYHSINMPDYFCMHQYVIYLYITVHTKILILSCYLQYLSVLIAFLMLPALINKA